MSFLLNPSLKGANMPTKDLTGSIAIVTGSNTGIGKETATALCEMGAHVVLACRGVLKAQACAEEMTKECKGTAEAMCLGESVFGLLFVWFGRHASHCVHTRATTLGEFLP